MLEQFLNPANYYFNPYAVPTLLVSILIFSIGIFVLRQNKGSIINKAFFYKCLAMGFWLFSIFFVYACNNPALAIKIYKNFTFLGVVNIMPSIMFFTMAWSGEIKRKKLFVAVNFSLSLAVYILVLTTDKMILPMRKYFWGYYPIYSFWLVFYLMLFFAQFIIAMRSLYLTYKLEKISIRKTQKKLVFIALLSAITASADFLPKFFNIAMYPYGYISMFFYISLVAYAIVKYRAFDIETVVHKTIIWLLSFSFIIIPIFFAYKAMLPAFERSKDLELTFWIFSFLITAFYLRVIQPKIDHLFQRRQANLEQISNRFSEDLVHLKDIGQLVKRIRETIAQALYPQRVDIFIYNEDRKNYTLANVEDAPVRIEELKAENRFLSWLAGNNKIAYKEFIDIDPAYVPVKEDAEEYFNLTGAILAIPLVLNEKLLGIINLGKKSNLKRYSAADSQFLKTLKNQSTIAIANSLLYENMEEQVRQRTRELVEVQKQLVQAEKLATMGILAGGVAHEINNPLTAILTNVQMLLSSDELDKESLELIEEATKRCRTIVQKLMAYAKKPMEATGVSRVDLSKAMKNVTTFLGYQLGQENIKINADTNGQSYWVMGDNNELEQVITNIILNARDAIKQVRKSGEVSVSISENGKWVEMEIKDDGPGIPPEVASKIFDPFFTTKDVGKGLGLGLSICQSIIEKHKGVIKVSSEVNRGSVFTVQLPKISVKGEPGNGPEYPHN